MGMLFNTDETIIMNRYVHQQMRNNWAAFIASGSTWEAFFRNLGTGGIGSTYTAVNRAPLSLTATAAGMPARDVKWHDWLDRLDAAGVSTIIGGHIADAIHNNVHYSGVEFHLLPDRVISARQLDFPDQDPARVPGTKFTSVIVINTVTWDNVHL